MEKRTGRADVDGGAEQTLEKEIAREQIDGRREIFASPFSKTHRRLRNTKRQSLSLSVFYRSRRDARDV